MGDKDPNSLDIFGIKPVGDAINTVTETTVKGAGTFLSSICLPAFQEFGFLLQDRVKHWRALQAAKIANKAEEKLNALGSSEAKQAHPRVVIKLLEEASLVEDDSVQEMWAGLLASSCTEDGKDDSNVLFVNLLSQLTGTQVKLLAYLCENTYKKVLELGSPFLNQERDLSISELAEITGLNDMNKILRERDHLVTLGLIKRKEVEPLGLLVLTSSQTPPRPDLYASRLGLDLYVRCQGSKLSVYEYFKEKEANA